MTDPQGLTTSYLYNGHNNLITQSSPDTGATQMRTNAMGNVTAKLDSMNRCSTTSYDNLHRVTSIQHYAASNASTNTPALCFATIAGTTTPEETQTYTYDSTTTTLGGLGGWGRLSRLTDATGSNDYVYDRLGRIMSKSSTLSGATNPNLTAAYTYNELGQLSTMITPSGETIAATYGAPNSAHPGKLIGLTLNGTTDLITNADYEPFGPNAGWDWGNHNSATALNQHVRAHDLDYRPTAIVNDPEGYTRNINWDQANRITGITVPTSGIGSIIPSLANAQSVNQAFQYDNLDRLTSFIPGNPSATTAATGLALLPKEDFTYDAIGNRTSRTTLAPGAPAGNAQTATYAYPNTAATPQANKRHILNSISGAQTNAYTYDASGNTLTESAAQSTINPATGLPNASSFTTPLMYTYDAKNRLSKAQIGTTATDTVTYKINAMGQRVQKTGAGQYAYNTSTTINATTGLSPQAASLQFNARYLYDEQGNLIGEYAPDGKLISETVWFNGMPVATLRPKGSSAQLPLGIAGTGATTANNAGNNTAANPVNVDVYYLHPDHLGTPRAATRSQPVGTATTGPNAENKAVWRWDSDPFGTSLGNSAPNENPQLVTGTATVVQAATFRQDDAFAGRRRDRESGKIYNNRRTYDSLAARYIESDPIGLIGGLSTFSYVSNAPMLFTDPRGLHKGDQWYGYNNKDFQKWFHRCWKQSGDPDASKEDIEAAHEEWQRLGSPKGGKCGGNLPVDPVPVPPPPPEKEREVCGKDCRQTLVNVVSAAGTVFLAWRVLCGGQY